MYGMQRYREIKYPVFNLVELYFFILALMLLIAYLKPSVREGYFLLIPVWTVLFYAFAQYRYTKVKLYHDRLRVSFLASLYLKDWEYNFSDITLAFFQFNVGSWVDPYVKFYFKNGRGKKIRMRKHELEQIRYWLQSSGIKIQIGRYAYDRPKVEK